MNGFSLQLELERPTARRGSFRLQAKLDTPPGISVVFGPSGSGKSTLLLSVLGALRPRRGRVEIAGRLLFDSDSGVDVPIRRRGVGMVFQDAPLFPHLGVLQNVAFGIRGADRLKRAGELLERVEASGLGARRVAELSGGERQRVALARALAARPSALLLDEPFSALDRGSRDRLGGLLIELQEEAGIPFLHVTHDVGEALRLGHHLVLLDSGLVVQSGSPVDVLARPSSLAAARAVGTENLFSGRILRHLGEAGCSEVDVGGTVVQTTLLDQPAGSRVALGLRAEDVLLSLEPLKRTSARNVISGTVEELRAPDPSVELTATTPVPFRVLVTPASVRELELAPGRRVWLVIKAAAFHRLV